MTEDKQRKVNDIIDEKQSLWLTVVKILAICLLVVVGCLAGLVAVLQVGVYDRYQEQQSVDSFLETVRDDISYSSEGVVIKVPETVVGATLYNHFSGQLNSDRFTITSYAYDGRSLRVYTNLTYSGFYLPLSYQVEFKQTGNSIETIYSDYKISRYNWSLSGAMERRLQLFLGLSETGAVYDLKTMGVNPGLDLIGIVNRDDKLICTFDVDKEAIAAVVEEIKAQVDPLLLEHYRTYSILRTQPVLEIVEANDPLTDDQLQLVVNSALTDQYLISDLLLLTKDYDMASMNDLLKSFGITMDMGVISAERKAFKGQAADPLIAEIFVALDAHFGDSIMGFNLGKPFDLEELKTMTVPVLIERYGIEGEPAIIPELSFVYEDAFKIAYRLDDNAYYIRGLDGYKVVDGESFASMMGSEPFVQPTYVEDPLLWQEVIDYAKEFLGSEGVFVRYMKSDGTSVFAVVSATEDPQDYWNMAIKKNDAGVFELIDGNVTSIVRLITMYPEFNAETVTSEIETIAFQRLDEDTHDQIIDEMYDLRFIASRRDTEIVYSSYDGSKYIAFMLNNGMEYVFKVQGTVYGTYLQTVYTKDKALNNWQDIPELLMLQEIPDGVE